ncbi:hypothetical protein EJ05DRAFT_541723 [Pseudovirgaria hyperparasitica]|uniref:Uncharacterized protein n=1 Tax=Pseudovirgaria hyperparasitica TaxID=470096 RepID=A0A6A6VVH3_9PEZI|nr:uncharacterized protein EJ05DRAFT_541723 [Pseudovirgaria hyperparasitica]KAF2753724.1 hypothetical protein EJ05DRAFT_541723 [Pseudovirgaria hyperparasitica]
MAFRQHMARPQPRLSFPASAPQQSQSAADQGPIASPLRKHALEDSEEWVLFTPVAESTIAHTHTTSTDRTRTAGLSRLSDFGSLDTAARSDQQDEYDDQHTEGSDREDDDHDLDSLDDGLHAFHDEDAGDASRRLGGSAQVLPTHDGLGSFPATSSLLQDQIRQFERVTPSKRHQRRRSSVQRRLDALEEQQEFHVDDEKMQRIERWRLEQSRALLEEIERETRRMRRSSHMSTRDDKSQMNGSTETDAAKQATAKSTQQPSEHTHQEEDSMSFLQRFTQRVIRDLMGIDESLLSVIFGEELPEEDMSTTPTPNNITLSEAQRQMDKGSENDAMSAAPKSWEHRLLERIARELGILVHQLSEHPGAFNTYLRTQESIPYAGLELGPAVSNTEAQTESPIVSESRRASLPLSSTNQFKPTLPAAQRQQTPAYSEASLWGIEEEEGPVSSAIPISPTAAAHPSTRLHQEREYWERDLDAKMVFRFLIKRFSPDSNISSARAGSPILSRTPTSQSNPAHRAAIIRQHHPLVNRNSESNGAANPGIRRRDVLHRHHYHPAGVQPIRLRSGSSCASQSTKKSKRSLSGGSSRNYWDIGGSVGSGPGVGAWGEV